ncbi:MAG: peptidylprolyl isomerase [Pseudomonadota bacterium]
MRNELRIVPAALAFLLAILALAIAPKTVRAEIVDRIAAIVGSEIITEVDVGKALAAKERRPGAAKANPATRQEVVDKLIDDALFHQLLSKSKIEVSDDDMARAIANVLHQNRMTIDQLKSEIAAKGMTYDEYKKQIERDIKRVKFINQVIGPQVKITDQDLRDYYQRNQDRFRGSQKAHIAEIILPLEGIGSQEEFDALAKTAMDIATKAKQGTSFESLAKQHSKGGNAAEGGDMGMVNTKELPPPVADAVKALKVGEVSPPVMAGSAIVIIKLISLPEIASGDFEKTRDDIYSALYDIKIEEALGSYMEKERHKAFIEIR